MAIEKMDFEPLMGDYQVLLTIENREVKLQVCDFAEERQAEALILANRVADWMSENLMQAKQFAAVELLELKNDVWLEENEDPLTAEQFIERITLTSVLIYAEGNFEMYYDDNDIFWGTPFLWI